MIAHHLVVRRAGRVVDNTDQIDLPGYIKKVSCKFYLSGKVT